MIYIVSNTRAERGPLESVIAALPEARVIGYSAAAAPHQVMAVALGYFTEALRDASLVILLGDRYETLAAALAATFLRVPIAHIHGGETTTGAFDDAFRDSIARLAGQSNGLHFCATMDAEDRIKDICNFHGSPRAQSIHLVGAPGLDGVPQNSAKRDRKLIVASYYAETMAADGGLAGCVAMLDALEQYAGEYSIFFSRVNADPGSAAVAFAIQEFIDRYPLCALWISPDTREQYLHLVQHAAFVIGNSSAGVIEAPWVGVPSVNIGNRQSGREMAASVFCAAPSVSSISIGIKSAFYWGAYAPPPVTGIPIYRGGAAPKIAEIVREFVAGRVAA